MTQQCTFIAPLLVMCLNVLDGVSGTSVCSSDDGEFSAPDQQSMVQLSSRSSSKSVQHVAPDPNETLRGGTWCEINAYLPDFSGMTVIACQVGPTIPGPQETDCCPIDTITALWEGATASGWGTPISNYLFETHPSDRSNVTYPIMLNQGQKKLLWDVQKSCTPGSQPSPEDLVCTNFSTTMAKGGRDAGCMYFHDAGLNIFPDGGLEAYNLLFTEEYPNRTYLKGKYQPIMRNATGGVFILQAHPSTNLTSGEPYIPGPNAQKVGEEGKAVCEWIETCCGELPDGWTLECGLLKYDATCGASCAGNSVLTDDLSGTWCLADSGAEVQ